MRFAKKAWVEEYVAQAIKAALAQRQEATAAPMVSTVLVQEVVPEVVPEPVLEFPEIVPEVAVKKRGRPRKQ